MNDIWSKYVQGAKTLYYSRKLRFNDMFAEQYKSLFDLDENKNLKILEIGCGLGALAGPVMLVGGYKYGKGEFIKRKCPEHPGKIVDIIDCENYEEEKQALKQYNYRESRSWNF